RDPGTGGPRSLHAGAGARRAGAAGARRAGPAAGAAAGARRGEAEPARPASGARPARPGGAARRARPRPRRRPRQGEALGRGARSRPRPRRRAWRRRARPVSTLALDTPLAGRYRVDRLLGRGGMALVYLAHDEALDRPVAVKLLSDTLAADEEYRARFLREARVAARLAHRNIVRIYDAGEQDGRPYIVMECVPGGTLDQVLLTRGRLLPAEAVAVAIQVCDGLDCAHAAGLVHRDVKPQNLLVAADGTVKIADFGIARPLEAPRLTATGIVLGTAAYLAPEQSEGEPVTAAADLYALGAVLYELLTGRPPHTAGSLVELLVKRLDEPVA